MQPQKSSNGQSASVVLDVCFLVDCTGSMGPYIEEVKKRIKEVVAALQAAHGALDLRVGFVGYRDYQTNVSRLRRG